VPEPPKTNPQPQREPGKPSGYLLGIESSFAGPLPPPQLLLGYEQACPGSAERIIEMAEKEGIHRRSLEQSQVDWQIEAMRRQFAEARVGQFLAFGVTALFLGCGTYIAVSGQPWAGALFGGIGLGGIVTTFILGRTRDSGQNPESDKAPKQTRPLPARRRK
jgi:uncharacterized membrane protein